MVEEVKGLGTGGGGVPYRPARRRAPEPARQQEEELPAGRREGDSAQLSRPPVSPEGIRELLGRIELLQKALLTASGEDALRDCRARLAGAEVALSNLLGAAGGPSEALLREALKSPPALSPERVLKLLGSAEGEAP